ncbi:pyridoxamine 5'-phosphate oxidase family protein [Natrialbaceae archaeon A-CW2]|uniref:pyridoxamine 5'-phosphate oxidase family protein n=1 Tax=Natronosalvus amylolyticus TaxID=2961994 RepID=UPI0020C9B8C4|nr:pyridoxamine 5'-phosphate oxidase family protein [Natronosalvus amylolyticus]
MRIRGSLTREEIDDYLSSTTVPVRLACHTPSGGLWMLSLWYRYRDGALECATAADANVVEYLEGDPTVAFEISSNQPPYIGVRGAGTASISPDPEKSVLRALLERYLGGTDSQLADTLLDESREEVVITVEPQTVYGWDFSDRMRDVLEEE